MDEAQRIRQSCEESAAGARAIQAVQAEFDSVAWQVQEPSWAKARHLLYHLISVTAQLAGIVEEVEHRQHRGEFQSDQQFRAALAARPDIGAKLVFHAAQVANLAGTDLGGELVRLHRRCALRFAPTSAFAELGEPPTQSEDP